MFNIHLLMRSDFMKKMFTMMILLLFVVLNVVACNPGASDYEYDLGNNYMLVRSSAHIIEVVPKGVYNEETDILPAKIVEIAWNDHYVIAKQFGMKRRSPNNENDTYEMPDLYKVYYWILDTNSKKRYGPYSKKEFQVKQEEFKLLDLQLESVEVYKK